MHMITMFEDNGDNKTHLLVEKDYLVDLIHKITTHNIYSDTSYVIMSDEMRKRLPKGYLPNRVNIILGGECNHGIQETLPEKTEIIYFDRFDIDGVMNYIWNFIKSNKSGIHLDSVFVIGTSDIYSDFKKYRISIQIILDKGVGDIDKLNEMISSDFPNRYIHGPYIRNFYMNSEKIPENLLFKIVGYDCKTNGEGYRYITRIVERNSNENNSGN